MDQPRRSYTRLIGSLVTLVVLLLGLWLIWWHQQAISDWWRLRGYDPPAEITQLAHATTMTDEGRHLFYVQHPRIEPSADFNKHCNTEEFTIVLGCYVSGRGIYLFRVDDARLTGVEQVTAAHEMLHVAYERLSSKERQRIDRLTAQAFDTLDDQRIRDNIEQYRGHDASVVPNELHSILGTEVRDLPAELQAYYAQYFADRDAVVAFSEQYEAAFSERQQQADALAARIRQLNNTINTKNTELQLFAQSLSAEYEALERMRDNADPTSFNARVSAYNASLARYNNETRTVSRLIDEHNALVNQYNQIVLEHKDLVQAITSRPEALERQE